MDVRVKRIDLPDEVSNQVYRRMTAERNKEAQELRSTGKERAEKIRASADRERTIELANAYRDAEKIRGEGDAELQGFMLMPMKGIQNFTHLCGV